MNSTITDVIHYSSVIATESMAALVLAIIMFAMLSYREHRRSSLYLFLAIAVEFLFLVGDAASFYNLSVSALPKWLTYISYFFSYTSGFLVLIPFSLYSGTFIMEKTPVNRGIYQIPIVLSLISVIIVIVAILSGSVYGVVEGKMAEINGVPAIASLIQIFVAIYLPVMAFIKRKQIGTKAVMLLGLFGIMPIACFFINYNYAGVATALSLIIVYVLLQCDISSEKEKQRKELKSLNEQLTDANEEKLAQIEEISALNSQLEENQARMEEFAAEQEAQLEEIQTLNTELVENRAQLQKAKDTAEYANSAKTSFLFNMSHDIRTPMNAILGFAELMEKKKDDPEVVTDYIEKIKSSGHFLLSLINNVLDMARIESGKMELDEEFCDLLSTKNNIVELFSEMAKSKNITLTQSGHVDHRYVMLDQMKVGQITLNLLSNAIKYTPEGGTVTYTFEEMPCEREGYATYVTKVSDTGIGMSEEFAKNIYDMFSRERNTTESKQVGAGLGMSIVKRLVDMMGGTIELKTEQGKGTTFIVTMSNKIVEDPEQYLKNELIQEETQYTESIKGRRVLLAEDNELNAEIALAILEDAGLKVERAEDGVQCIKMLSEATDGYYDAILMDVQMPNMDGYEATGTIRAMENKAKANIPILAMTANAFEEDVKRSKRAGMNGHLSKPIDVAELMKALSTVILYK